MIDLMVRGYVKPPGFPDLAVPTIAIYSGRSTERKLKGMFGDRRMEDLHLPCFTVSADLRSAESVIQETGRVWRATRTSCSIPGMLPPLPWRGRLLVDGGLLDNLPVDALRQRCHGRIVASDVSVAVEFENMPSRKLWPFGAKTNLPGIAQIMMRTAQLASVRDSRDAGTPADLYLNPGLHDVGMSDFSRIDEIVERGAAFARKQLLGWAR
jgi:predicted acylesterase/phospholipase RssA